MNKYFSLSSTICLAIISGFTLYAQQTPISSKFKLLTTLYNEKNEKRRLEFITCIETNLKNTSIDTIHVIYDTAKDDVHGSLLLDYLKTKNVKISYMPGRPSYGDFFAIANNVYPNCKVMVSNADIFFNETLALLESYDLRDKFLALTRWTVRSDGTLVECSPRGSCQDTWFFQTPLRTFENSSIKIGTWGCEHAIAYQAQKSGLTLFNPSRSIQCCHLHLSDIHNSIQDSPYKNMGKITVINKCTIMEMDETQRTLYLDKLRLRAGRRTPIILNNI